LDIWREKERNDFLAVAKIFFPVVAVLYLAHYWAFDLPMGLEPPAYWLIFRVSMVIVAVAAYAYYSSPLGRVGSYRTVAMVAGAIFCVSQAWVTYYYPEAPWIYCYVFVIVASLILRTSVIKSLIYALLLVALQWPILMKAGVAVPETVSATGVCILAIVAMRGSYLAEIRYFLLNQQNVDAQRRNIELNIEFTDRIKSFIPRQIATRLERHLKDRDTSVLNAIYEVLKPRKREIACLFSDIRGFTEGSKELDAFIRDSVLPNVKACTDAVENNGGIPRKIGDLIFAYFDDSSVHLNLIRAVAAGLEIARINEDQNLSAHNSQIQRYILISVGEAIVGNVGGFDSSVEITALGSPVNFLSRLDELTKHPELRKRLLSSDLVICDKSLRLLHDMNLRPEVTTIDLAKVGVSIRNFQDQTIIHAMRPTEDNRRLLRNFYDRLLGEGWPVNEDRSQAA
jgi:class 3 adenylate cyclase